MSESVLYCDVVFTKTRERTKEAASTLTETTYSEVKISTMQPPTEQTEVVSNRRPKVTSERVSLLVLSVLLIAAVVGLGVTLFYNFKTKEYLQTLQNDNEVLRKNLTEKLCPKCETSWEHYGGKCYYFSKSASTWQQSREECRHHGGDLVQIDSREEQKFLEESVRKEMSHDEDKFWIGLTDSVEEGKWLWVDGSSLNTSLTFWSQGEPSDYTGEDPAGEDCARMGEKGETNDLKCWYDRTCKANQRRICEKSAETGF